MRRWLGFDAILLGVFALLPVLDALMDLGWQVHITRIMIFAIVALGLNVITGFTGLLHLGIAALMAIGVYSYGILTCSIYPFRIGFWPGLLCAGAAAGLAGVLLGAPTLRLRGDYLAIVTMGFGEIVVDVLRNLEVITKGQKGINPLPQPGFPFMNPFSIPVEVVYYIFLAIVVGLALLGRNFENSKLGRQWVAIREDELAAQCMSINPAKVKIVAFSVGSAMAGIAGALMAAQLTTTSEPQTYDFNVSIMALCILIVGGIGNIRGVLLGAVILMGFDTIVVNEVKKLIPSASDDPILGFYLDPTYWKWMLFGGVLVLVVRFRPEGFFPSQRAKLEMHHGDEDSEAPPEEGAS